LAFSCVELSEQGSGERRTDKVANVIDGAVSPRESDKGDGRVDV
jgi:hypothetical protein